LRELHSTPDTVQPGVFDGTAPAVAKVASGEAFAVRTLTRSPLDLASYDELGPAMVAIEAAFADRPGAWIGPHPALGPIEVEGHPQGCTLQIDLLEIEPDAPAGWNGVREGYGVVPDLDGTTDIEVVPVVDGEVRLRSGVVVPVRPFFGVLAVRPDPALGPLDTIPPGPFGGNVDCRELVTGTRLFLPTFTDGAGFLIGDGHGTQGDGEITETALEIAMRGVVRLTSRPELDTDRPLAATPDATVFFGFGATFDEAATDVVAHAAARIEEWTAMPGIDAYRLFSLACDVRVTQLVNGVVGAHLVVPRSITEQLDAWPQWLHL
jgi:acetamidase/formamidase